MPAKLPLPHFSLSLAPLLSHPWILAVPALFILMFLASVWRMARQAFAVVAVLGIGYGLYRLAKTINHASQGSKSSWINMPTVGHGTSVVGSMRVLQIHSNVNDGLVVVLGILTLAALLLTFVAKLSGYSIGYVLNRMWVLFINPVNGGCSGELYQFPNTTIGVGIGEAEPGLPGSNERAGKKVTIDAKDRFLNTGIIGPIGSGKTFMTMKPMIYQDLEAIAKGTMANMVWISPQPEPSLEKYAESLGVTVRRIHIIDGQVDGKGTNIRFNPLPSGNIDASISNVNILLNEQTGDKGKGDAFFDVMAAQATTDSLQLYKYLHGFDDEGNPIEIDMIGWYDNYLVQMDELFYEAQRVQIIANQEDSKKLGAQLDRRMQWIRDVMWPQLNESERIMLRRAAASIINEFGGDVSGKNAEAYKNIIRGLRGKVRVLISSGTVQELLGSDIERAKNRPNFSFEEWIDPKEWMPPKFENPYPMDGGWFSRWISKRHFKKYVAEQMKQWKAEAPHGRKGELLSVITGQQDVGKLVGRMVLVFLQQAVLNRPGKDNDKPPIYSYVDEYPSYATKSINEIRTQGRKHCHSMVMAMQARAQMEEVTRGYLETMEGSTRHWVYLSNLGLDDAMQVAKLCGKVRRIRVDKSARQLRMGGLGQDDGKPLVTKSEREELVDRFSVEYIRYKLGANEVLYVGVKNRQGLNPLRMRITEPREDKALVRQLTRRNEVEQTASPNKHTKKKEKARRVPVYPRKDLVAKVKWPLLTFGDKTLYVYRWGISIGRDMYGPTEPVDFSVPPPPPQPLQISEQVMDIPSEAKEHLKWIFSQKPNQSTPPTTSSEADKDDNEGDPYNEAEEQEKLCQSCGVPMNSYEKVGGKVGYRCPNCQGTIPRPEKIGNSI